MTLNDILVILPLLVLANQFIALLVAAHHVVVLPAITCADV
jgi:hypothetical protein